MADVAITLKLTADEFQTLRTELAEHESHLTATAKAHRESSAFGQERQLLQRAARVAVIRERLG